MCGPPLFIVGLSSKLENRQFRCYSAPMKLGNTLHVIKKIFVKPELRMLQTSKKYLIEYVEQNLHKT